MNFNKEPKKARSSNAKTTLKRNLKGSSKTESKRHLNGIKKESERNLKEEPNMNLKGKAT